MNSLQLEKFQPVHFDQIDRASVRRFVEEYTLAAQAVGAQGGNIHQWSLDRQDEVSQFAAGLTDEQAGLFWTLYNEEMSASSNAMLDKANELNIQAAEVQIQSARNASNVAIWVSLIVFFGFLIFMIRLFKN